MIINGEWFNAELEDIIQELQIQLQANGIDLLQKTKNMSNDIMVCCPYHLEKRPSAGIRKTDGKFHCFACEETHELQEVISYCFGKDDILGKFGWRWLLKNFSIIEREERKDVKIDLERNNISRKSNILDNSNDNKSNWITEKELDSYRYMHSYMYERKLTDEIIELFDIGYDQKTQCLTFPVRDINGNCLFVARRSVKTKYFNYPSGVEKPLYGLYELYRCLAGGRGSAKININSLVMPMCGEVIVCESMLDALTAWVYGKYAVALNGLGTYLQLKALEALPCRKLIIATDNDEAGQKARERIKGFVKGKIITEYVIPDGKKDLNDLTKEEFENLLEIF